MSNEDIAMATRIAQVIEYKTGGNKTEFGRLMGWSKQYVGKLVKGDAVGISVITNIASKFPDINVRWLLLGEGNMVDATSRVLRDWFTLEEYIPVMTAEDRDRIDQGKGYTLSDINRWSVLLKERNDAITARFAQAYARQQILVKKSEQSENENS